MLDRKHHQQVKTLIVLDTIYTKITQAYASLISHDTNIRQIFLFIFVPFFLILFLKILEN